MKILRSVIMLIIGLLLFFNAAAMADPPQNKLMLAAKKTPAAQPVSSPQQVPAPVKKLPHTIKINPNDLTGLKTAEIVILSNEFYAAWKRVTDSYNAMSTLLPAYEQQSRIYIAKCRECKNKSYSQQEMTLAGCAASDTVADCSKKLYRWCSASAEPQQFLAIFSSLSVIGDYGQTAKAEFIKSILHQK